MKNEPLLAFTAREQRNALNVKCSKLIRLGQQCSGLVKPSSSMAVVARFAGTWSRTLNTLSWVKIDITNTYCTKAADGMYYIRFNKGWLPRQAVVEAGTSEIPSRRTGDQLCLMQPGMELGTGVAPQIGSDLSKAHFTSTPLETVNAVRTRETWNLKNLASPLRQF